MSISEILSQDEVDNLLSQDIGEQKMPAKGQNIDICAFFPKAIQSIHGIHQFATINKIFSDEATKHISQLLDHPVDIEINNPTIVSYKEFIHSLTQPVTFNYVSVKPLSGLIMITFSYPLVQHLINRLFGGKTKTSTDYHHKIGNLDIEMSKLLIDAINKSLTTAWETLSKLEFRYLKSTLDSDSSYFSEPNENIIVSINNLIINQIPLSFSICYPVATLKPIKELLNNATASSTDNKESIHWKQSIREGIVNIPVNVTANNSKTCITLNELLQLKEGDIIPIDHPDQATLLVDDMPLYTGRYADKDGKKVIRIEQCNINSEEKYEQL